MSWTRGGKQNNSEQDMEAQNDEHLEELASKLSLLRGVTTDIYRDSQSQNSLLDTTANSFNSFQLGLKNTTNKFTRSIQNGSGYGRLQLLIILGIISLFFLYKLFY